MSEGGREGGREGREGREGGREGGRGGRGGRKGRMLYVHHGYPSLRDSQIDLHYAKA